MTTEPQNSSPLAALYASLAQLETKIAEGEADLRSARIAYESRKAVLDGYKEQRRDINAKIRSAKARPKKPDDGVPEFLKRTPAA